MSPAEVVRRLAKRGIELRVQGGEIVARGPLGALLEVAEQLHGRREELREYLKSARPAEVGR